MDRVSGAVISKHATALRLQTSSGSWYVANQAFTTDAQDTFYVWYKTGGGDWTLSSELTLWSDIFDGGTSTVYNSYQNGTSLGTLSVAGYGVYWIYQCPQGDLYVVLGSASYSNIGQAQAASIPASLPPYCVNYAKLVGKVICAKEGAALYSVETVFGMTFTQSSATDHASLANLPWGSSAHSGTASTIAGFSGAGAAAEYTLSGTGTALPTTTAPTFVTSITTPSVLATANDSGALGASGTAFSDLFLASGAVINFDVGASTITHSANTLTIGGSGATTLALGANSITMTGSLAATGARVTKGWFTDAEFTNAPTIGGNALGTIYAAIAQTFYIGTTQVAINRSSAALTLAGITLTTPDIGTPSAGTLTNCTGYPINIVDDTTPELGGEMDCGAHSIGFTQGTATGDGTTTIDWKLGNKFYFTFGNANETFTFTAPSNPCNLVLVLKQYSTGGKTATWPNTVMWPGGTAPTLSTGNNDIDIVSMYFDGTNYFAVASLDFSVPA
jgi:hypothetical protein